MGRDDDNNDNDLDVVFTEIGEFGVFQVFTFVLICIPNMMFATYVVNYIFATNTLDYRSVKWHALFACTIFISRLIAA